MTDVFKFHPTSADAAPGKGNGETLVSPASTYAELRKVTNWRRQLASGDTSFLPLTGKAELWEALPRKPHVRRTDLEELRFKGNIPEQADTMEPVAKSSKKPRSSKKATAPPKEEEEVNINTVDSGSNAKGPAVWVGNIPEVEEEFTPPDMDEKEESSTLHFCPVCRNYLFAQIEKEVETDQQTLIRLCRNCGYKQTDVKGGLVSEIVVGERSAESYKILLNEFTAEDPRLPHLHGTIKCPDPVCPSHNSTSDIIYMKYDQVNLNFLYICYVCKFTWHSTR
jgi:DNA-directed RNA polymerase subunit M/transcription elongation factor TFIIS